MLFEGRPCLSERTPFLRKNSFWFCNETTTLSGSSSSTKGSGVISTPKRSTSSTWKHEMRLFHDWNRMEIGCKKTDCQRRQIYCDGDLRCRWFPCWDTPIVLLIDVMYRRHHYQVLVYIVIFFLWWTSPTATANSWSKVLNYTTLWSMDK